MAKVWFDENSHKVSLVGLKNDAGAYIDDASVTARMVDDDGVDLGGIAWPVVLLPDGNLVGTYEADLSQALVVDPMDRAALIIDAVKDNAVGRWTCKVNVKARGC